MAAGDVFDTTSTLDPSAFHLDDTAQENPPPTPPSFATIFPTAVMDEMQRQQQADEYGQAQQAKLADLWGKYADAQLQNTIDAYMKPPESGEPTPTTYEPQQDTNPQPTQDMVTQAPAAPQPTMFDHGQQFAQGLLSAIGGVKDALANPETTAVNAMQSAGVQPDTPGLGGLMQGYQANAALPAAQQTEMGVTPALYAAGDNGGELEAAAPLAKLGAGAVQEGAQAAGKAIGPLADTAGQVGGMALRAPLMVMLGAGGAAGGAGKVAPKLLQKLSEDPALAKSVQELADKTGVDVTDAAGVQRLAAAVDKATNDNTIANLQKVVDKNLAANRAADHGLTEGQQDAIALRQIMDSHASQAEQAPEDIWNSVGKGPDAEPATPQPTGPTVTAENRPIETMPNADSLQGDPYTGAGESKLAESPVVKGLNAIQGTLKQAVLAGSVFHPLVEEAQLGRTALAAGKPIEGVKAMATAARGMLPGASDFAQKYAAENADVIQRAVDAGATGMRVGSPVGADVQQVGNRLARTLLSSGGAGVTGYATGKAQGLSDEDALKRGAVFAAGGAGVAQLAPAMNKAMFGQMIPMAKTEAYKMLEPQYGAEVAAKRVNDTFGGQNLAQLGRNPELQTILKTTFLSPDWLESWARNLGAVVKPGLEGDAARKYWAATGISGAMGLEGLNMALNGHSTTDNEPGRQLQLEITPIVRAMGGDPTKRYYADVLELGPLGSALQAGARGGIGAVGANLAGGHLNAVPDIALGAVKNLAPSGGQIVQQNTPAAQAIAPEIAAAGEHAAPIGVSTFEKPDIPVPAGLASTLAGVKISSGPAGVPAQKAPSNALGSGGSRVRAFPSSVGVNRPAASSASKGGSFLNPSTGRVKAFPSAHR